MWDNSITEYTIVYINGITGIINAPNDVMYVKIEKFQMYLDDDFYKFIDNYKFCMILLIWFLQFTRMIY